MIYCHNRVTLSDAGVRTGGVGAVAGGGGHTKNSTLLLPGWVVSWNSYLFCYKYQPSYQTFHSHMRRNTNLVLSFTFYLHLTLFVETFIRK